MTPYKMLDKEFDFFQKNKQELVKKYGWKVIVIKWDEILWFYDTEEIAYTESIKTHKLWTFLIQKCTEQDKVAMFNSRVVF